MRSTSGVAIYAVKMHSMIHIRVFTGDLRDVDSICRGCDGHVIVSIH